MMNAGTIVGYITQLNGNPISGAEIRICETSDAKGKTSAIKSQNPSVRTDSRGYFQLPLVACEADIKNIFGIGGILQVSFGKQKNIQKIAENCFQLTGYLIKTF